MFTYIVTAVEKKCILLISYVNIFKISNILPSCYLFGYVDGDFKEHFCICRLICALLNPLFSIRIYKITVRYEYAIFKPDVITYFIKMASKEQSIVLHINS